jgi:hypothetical protein
MVIADTSVWIPFFNRPNSAEKHALDALIDADDVVMLGVVLAELLQGCRSPKELIEVKDALLALRYIEVSQRSWIAAGEISATLLRSGVTLPMSDLIIGAVALERACSVYTLDRHFSKIPGLVLYSPPGL